MPSPLEISPSSFASLLKEPPPDAESAVTTIVLDRLLLWQRLRALYGKLRAGSDRPLMTALLAELRIRCEVEPEDRARIPVSGPVIAVANHPFGILEGAVLGDLLRKVRPDVKIMTNHLLEGVPELEGDCIFVDPFAGSGSALPNSRAMRRAIGWLRQGGMLVTFPAGEVSHWDFGRGEVTDPQWSDTAVRLIRITGASALPAYFKGANGLSFHLLGMVNPRLRTLALIQELFNKEGHTVDLRFGSAIQPQTIRAIPNYRDATQYLRWRTYLLASRGDKPIRLVPRLVDSVLPKKQLQPIAAETDGSLLTRDVQALTPAHVVERAGDQWVFLASADLIPNVLRELGRLREIAFREAGEGTGASLDLDAFDAYYQHLFVWNDSRSELVGAYRVGDTERILSARGVEGLYTSTLFDYDPLFFARIGPALELGRSFVRPEYQRQYAPLLLLWKGLCRYIAREARTPILFGAVSISNSYTPATREMLAKFFASRIESDGLAGLVRPRRPFHARKTRARDIADIVKRCPDLSALSDPIADIETGGKGIPVLLRQYVKAGGRLLGFSVDKHFANSLDGLVLVDLRRTEPALLARYMTERGAAEFLRFHGVTTE